MIEKKEFIKTRAEMMARSLEPLPEPVETGPWQPKFLDLPEFPRRSGLSSAEFLRERIERADELARLGIIDRRELLGEFRAGKTVSIDWGFVDQSIKWTAPTWSDRDGTFFRGAPILSPPGEKTFAAPATCSASLPPPPPEPSIELKMEVSNDGVNWIVPPQGWAPSAWPHQRWVEVKR